MDKPKSQMSRNASLFSLNLVLCVF